jgi:hypothetical protein
MVKNLFITLGIVAVILIVFYASNRGSPPYQAPIADSTPESFSETLKNPFFRKIFAHDEFAKVARDPDSVVVESASDVTHLKLKNGSETLGFLVKYRAKNGFGGYNRETKWIFCDLNGNNVQLPIPSIQRQSP